MPAEGPPGRAPPKFDLTCDTVRGDVVASEGFAKYMMPHIGSAYRREPELIVLPRTQGGIKTASIHQKLPAGYDR